MSGKPVAPARGSMKHRRQQYQHGDDAAGDGVADRGCVCPLLAEVLGRLRSQS
jgi:hypothetical protein